MHKKRREAANPFAAKSYDARFFVRTPEESGAICKQAIEGGSAGEMGWKLEI
jgi:hypothetical protein